MMVYVLVFVGWKPRRGIAGTYAVGGTARLDFKAAPNSLIVHEGPNFSTSLATVYDGHHTGGSDCVFRVTDITPVVLTAFFGWLRITSIFS